MILILRRYLMCPCLSSANFHLILDLIIKAFLEMFLMKTKHRDLDHQLTSQSTSTKRIEHSWYYLSQELENSLNLKKKKLKLIKTKLVIWIFSQIL